MGSERYVEIGRRITERREARGLSASELALALGVDRKTLARWEAGATEPIALEALIRMAELLGVSEHFLIHGGPDALERLDELERTVRDLKRHVEQGAPPEGPRLLPGP